MSNKIVRVLRHFFQMMLGWSLVKKSQLLLIYASLMKLGLYVLLFIHQDHPLLDQAIAANLSRLIMILVGVNVVLIGIGQAIRWTKKHNIYSPYALFILTYYALTMLIVPVMIGFLNVVNGFILMLTIMSCMIFFPKKITRIVNIIFAVGYFVIISFTFLKYLDYGLLFQTHILMHPLLMNSYLLGSVIYATFLTVLILYLFRLCIDAWHEKMYFTKDFASYQDNITGLLNAYGAQQITSMKLREANLLKAELSMVILDIDNFKRILSDIGKAHENNILKHVADLLTTNLRQSDIVARYDIEQFLLVLAFTSIDRAEEVAEMCRKTLEQTPLQLDNGQYIYVKASFGVSSTEYEDFEFDRLLVASQKAMYLAKENGKNQVYSMNT